MNRILAMLSKIIAVLMSFFYMFSGGNPDKVTVSVVNQPTDETTVIEYEIENYSGVTVYADAYFTIEKNVDGNWVAVPFADDATVNDIAIEVRNCQTVTLKIDLNRQYGHTLDEGTYRLVLAYVNTPAEFIVTPA